MPPTSSHPGRPRAQTDVPPTDLEQLAERLAAAVERSPADETEVVWTETLSGRVAAGGGGGSAAPPGTGGADPSRRDATVQVRIRERGRVGFHRTGPGRLDAGSEERAVGELGAAVRLALGQARLSPEAPPLPLAGPGGRREIPDLHDPAVAALTPEVAADLLAAGRGDDDHLALDWHELRLAVANSRGLVRSAAATTVTLSARRGEGAGAGWALGSARSLAALAAPRIVERAGERAVPGGQTAGPPSGPVPVLLSPEAAARLVHAACDATLTSRAFLDRSSWLTGRLDQPVVDVALTLVDDGTDPDGLPFPFDADGWPKRRVVLLDRGVLRSPAIDAELGRALGRTPTPHAIAFDESRAGNLFLEPGEGSLDDLLAAADGGLWLGALEDLRVTDPRRGSFRTLARGVRRIEGGRVGPAVPDLVWRGELAVVLATLAALGRETALLAAHGAWGGTRAPALVVPAAELAPAA